VRWNRWARSHPDARLVLNRIAILRTHFMIAKEGNLKALMSTHATAARVLLCAFAGVALVVNAQVARAQSEPYEAPDGNTSMVAGEARRAPGKAATTTVIDDFESGVGAWVRNDALKTATLGDALLVDVIATGVPVANGTLATGGTKAPLAPAGGAALFSFKAADKAWASASRRVSGARWVQMGARRLTFWLNGDGAQAGTELLLRARVKGADGAARDELYSVPLRLQNKSWRRVVVPLADLQNANGPLLPNMAGVYLMQFAQRGSWTSRFFTVDQIQIEGTGVPLVLAAVAPRTGNNSVATATITRNNTLPQLQVSVDFLEKRGAKIPRIRTGANVSIGASDASATGTASNPLASSAPFRNAIKTLAPRFVRLDASSLVELVDSQRPAFDYARLVASVKQVRTLNAEPLIALVNDPAWGLDERGYAVFASGAARAINANNARAVRWFELVTGASPSGDGSDSSLAVAFYNRARTSLKALSPLNRVGGMGASSGQSGALSSLLARAQGLDFLSLQFYAATSTSEAGVANDATLFQSARALKNLRLATATLDKSRFRNAPLFVTQSNLNGAREDGTSLPSDNRTTQMVSAAWWANYLGTSSRLADQVFHNDAVNPEWGLLSFNKEVGAYPAYYSLWMWNNFFPAKSSRINALVTRAPRALANINALDLSVVAANAPASHNVMLANTSRNDLTIRLSIKGFPILRAAVMHVLEDPAKGVRSPVPLPKSAFQTITLKPYSVAVIQFIEPPRAR